MKFVKAILLSTIILSFSVSPMRMTETSKKYAQKVTKHLSSYFIYSLDTGEGIWVDKKFAIENSEYIRMLSQRSQSHELGLPFSFESIKLTFDALHNKIDLRKLTLEQLDELISVADFLLAPNIIYKAMDENMMIKNASLDYLVELANRYGKFTIYTIGKAIMDRVNNICWATYIQEDIDHNLVSKKEQLKQYLLNSLQSYSGKMIAIRPGHNALMIPDYTALNNMNKEVEMLFKKKFPLEGDVLYKLTDMLCLQLKNYSECMLNIQNKFNNESLIDFLNFLIEKVQSAYNASLPWYSKFLGI